MVLGDTSTSSQRQIRLMSTPSKRLREQKSLLARVISRGECAEQHNSRDLSTQVRGSCRSYLSTFAVWCLCKWSWGTYGLLPSPWHIPSTPGGHANSRKQSHHPSPASPATVSSTTDRAELSNQGKDPTRTQTSSQSLSDDTPTRKAHCLLCGITQIPNISLRNTKTRNHTVESSSFHLVKDEIEITSEWGLPSRQCKRLAPCSGGDTLCCQRQQATYETCFQFIR